MSKTKTQTNQKFRVSVFSRYIKKNKMGICLLVSFEFINQSSEDKWRWRYFSIFLFPLNLSIKWVSVKFFLSFNFIIKKHILMFFNLFFILQLVLQILHVLFQILTQSTPNSQQIKPINLVNKPTLIKPRSRNQSQ